MTWTLVSLFLPKTQKSSRLINVRVFFPVCPRFFTCLILHLAVNTVSRQITLELFLVTSSPRAIFWRVMVWTGGYSHFYREKEFLESWRQTKRTFHTFNCYTWSYFSAAELATTAVPGVVQCLTNRWRWWCWWAALLFFRIFPQHCCVKTICS